MAVVENLRSKTLYKLEILILKYISFILAFIYFINTIFGIFGIDIAITSYIAGMSLLPWCFILISSFVFKFCSYHRIPLYYILFNNIVTTIDWYFYLPISDKSYLSLHCVVFLIAFITVFMLRKKCNKNDKHTKEIST